MKESKCNTTVKAISVVQKECNFVDLLQRLVDFGNENIFENVDLTMVLLNKTSELN
jgi:hypothetical protein